MKGRYNIIVMLVLSVCIMAGCGRSAENNKEMPDTTPEPPKMESNNNAKDETKDKELLKIGFAQVGHESAWRKAATENAKETFSEKNGYDLTLVDCYNNPALQKRIVKEFIAQEMDYIIIDPIVTSGWDNVMKAAADSGIPVFVIDRTIDCESDMFVAWFGSNFKAEGEAAGAWLEAYLENTGRDKDAIKIVTIAGTEGSSAQKGRTKGFDKYIDKHSNWEKYDEKDGKFTQSGGEQVMEEFIKEYPGINVVICQNDNEAWGAMKALDAHGIEYGVGKDVIIISFDAVHESMERMLEGKINLEIECNPLSAPYVADAIQKMEKGEEITNKINYVNERCFQAEDVVDVIKYGRKTHEMTTVTEQLVESRAY